MGKACFLGFSFRSKAVLISVLSCLFLLATFLLGNVFGWFKASQYEKTLAGEVVPFDKAHQFNIERFDRELAVNALNEAQMMMIWKRIPLFKPFIDQKLKEA
ncbi:MAG: hypothetical protein Q4B28_00120 [bacterium]|nr:hypothetical protein [bacterium]